MILDVPEPTPQPRFIQWVEAYGVRELAKRLGIARSTVQSWKRPGTGRWDYTPRPWMAFACILLSQKQQPCADGAALTFFDIYGDPEELLNRDREVTSGPARTV